MITFRNIETEEMVNVYDIKLANGVIKAGMHNGREKGQKFCSLYSRIFTEYRNEDKMQCFRLCDGWEIVKKATKAGANKPKPRKKAEKKEAEPKPEKKASNVPDSRKDEIFYDVLFMVMRDRVAGRWPFLHGPAGSGKSTLAEDIAKELNLPYYSVSSLQQKYDLEGYTDAVGKYVETAFYKAFSEGGIFCFDEITSSPAEVLVAFNTAAANLIYNFPKIGLIKAHPDFHIIACDNTLGTGADSRYTARFVMDESTRDRFTPYEVGYRLGHEMAMAKGDAELVNFAHDVREAIELSETRYLCSPRMLQAFKGYTEGEDGWSEEKALYFTLCSAMHKEDLQSIAKALKGSSKYHTMLRKIAEKKAANK